MVRLDFSDNDNADISLDGLKLAKVITNVDLKQQNRVGVRVLGVHDIEHKDPDYFIWATWLQFDKATTIQPPDVDDWIYVMFPDKTNPMLCVWLGFAVVSN